MLQENAELCGLTEQLPINLTTNLTTGGEFVRHTVDAVFPEYKGARCFMVIHPDMKPCTVHVLAPNESAAVVAAADAWHTRWESVDFYARCVVHRC